LMLKSPVRVTNKTRGTRGGGKENESNSSKTPLEE